VRRTTLGITTGIATTVVGTGLTAVLAAGPATAATPSGPPADYAGDARSTTNARRVDHGRHRVGPQTCLQRKAARHAEQMASADRAWHQDLKRVVRACEMRKVGENVAVGFQSGRTTVNRGWMRSSSHRQNLLDRRFDAMGLAARRSDDGQWYVAQVFGDR
jgi:uncharacterized protein YkwD